MKTETLSTDFDESDLKYVTKSFEKASFRDRFIRTDLNAPDPDWNVHNAKPIAVGDGLSVEILTNTHRKYAIYVYAYLETSAAPHQEKNELRFVTLDIDARVPFVVVEETLL
jgi:hypothetical protein